MHTRKLYPTGTRECENERKNSPGSDEEIDGLIKKARRILQKTFVSVPEVLGFANRQGDDSDVLRNAIGQRLSREADALNLTSVGSAAEALSSGKWIGKLLSDDRINAALKCWDTAYGKASNTGWVLGIPRNKDIFQAYLDSAAGKLTTERDEDHSNSFAEWLVNRVGEAVSAGLTPDNLSIRRQVSWDVFKATNTLLNAISPLFNVVFDKPTQVTSDQQHEWLIQGELARKLGSRIRSDDSYIQPTLVVRAQLRIGEDNIFPGVVA